MNQVSAGITTLNYLVFIDMPKIIRVGLKYIIFSFEWKIKHFLCLNQGIKHPLHTSNFIKISWDFIKISWVLNTEYGLKGILAGPF